MRHRKNKKILGRNLSRRDSLEIGLIKSFFSNKKIVTSEQKAKFIKPIIEKYITLGKKSDLVTRRKLLGRINDNQTINQIFEVSKNYLEKKGGYTRIINLKYSVGDNSKKVLLSLV